MIARPYFRQDSFFTNNSNGELALKMITCVMVVQPYEPSCDPTLFNVPDPDVQFLGNMLNISIL
jgi:hypothetical protein